MYLYGAALAVLLCGAELVRVGRRRYRRKKILKQQLVEASSVASDAAAAAAAAADGDADEPGARVGGYELGEILITELNRPLPTHLIDYAYRPPNKYKEDARPFNQGSHGEVWRAFDKKSGGKVVMKKILQHKGYGVVQAGKREIHFGEFLLPHENIVRFVEHFYLAGDSQLWLVFGDHGESLRQLMYVSNAVPGDGDGSVIYTPSPLWLKIRNMASMRGGRPPSERSHSLVTVPVLEGSEPSVGEQRRLDRDRASNIFRKLLHMIISGAAHLERNGVVHRDIKPSNIFCEVANFDLNNTRCVLGDFSSSVDEFTLKNYYKGGPSKDELTLQYAPPEVLFSSGDALDSEFSYQSTYDSWSIGVVALEMMLGTPDVFSVDQRTQVLLTARLKKEGATDEMIEKAITLASLADFCIYDHHSVVKESGWLAKEEDLLDDSAMVVSRCDLEDFRKALLARDQLQVGFSSPSSDHLLFLIWQLLQYDPRKRLTPQQALSHPYFVEAGDVDGSEGSEQAYPESTSRALQSQSTETTIANDTENSVRVIHRCPKCGKTFGMWNSCHQHVTKRKHGHVCQYIFENDSDHNATTKEFTCLSAHSLLPVDSTSGYCDIQGRRRVIEDFHSIELNSASHFYGVFDGHNGNLAAKFAAKFLFSELKEKGVSGGVGGGLVFSKESVASAFDSLNDKLLRMHPHDVSGSTATVIIKVDGSMVVANIGDSRAILCSREKGFLRQITVDHNPSNESEHRRILELGGKVEAAGGVMRVDGKLAVSRSFGDPNVRGVISHPHVEIIEMSGDSPGSLSSDSCSGGDGDGDSAGSSCYVILATDGLWDVVSNSEGCDLAMSVIGEKKGSVQKAAESLTLEAWVRGSKDNIGVCVVQV